MANVRRLLPSQFGEKNLIVFGFPDSMHPGLNVRLPGIRAHRSDAVGRPARVPRAHKRLVRAPLPPGEGRRDDHGIQGAAAYHLGAE